MPHACHANHADFFWRSLIAQKKRGCHLRGWASRPLRDGEFFHIAEKEGLCLPCRPQFCLVPVKQGKVAEIKPWAYMSPLDLVQALVDGGFHKALVPCGREIEDFWAWWLKDNPYDEFHHDEWKPYLRRTIPLQLWGDEGSYRESSWLILTLMSMLCPDHVRTLSQASRYILLAFPEKLYVKDKKGSNINTSIQMLMDQVVLDLNKLYRDGVETQHGRVYGRVINLKGDWKFFCQALNLTRSPSHDNVCLFCDAGKNASMLYTNCSNNAAWRDTLFSSAPWKVLPKIMEIKGFLLHFVTFDLMHTWHLGCGRDLIGTTLKEMVRAHLFQGCNREERLANAYHSLRSFVKENNKQLALHKFTHENLNWYSDTTPAALSHRIIFCSLALPSFFRFVCHGMFCVCMGDHF